MIDGVVIKELLVHVDDRGFFCELIRNSDSFFEEGFGQLSYSMSFAGVTKAWHLHHRQTEWMCVLVGNVRLALYDTREESRTSGELMEISTGETLGRKTIRIPPGVAHGYRVLSGPMHIVYVADREYDPDDDLRIPHDDPSIGYDWTAGSPIR